MSASYWAKLYIEMLDDTKVGFMDDWLFRRFIFFILAAKEYNKDGLLQPINKLAWRLRMTEEQTLKALADLQEINITRETPEGWMIINYAKYQAPVPGAERMRHSRAKQYSSDECVTKRNSDVTTPSISISISDSDSFSTLRDEVIKLTGLQVLQGDIKTLVEWDKEQVTEDDIRDALQWRKDQGLQPVKIISQLAGGVATSRARRVQDQSARKNGGQPKEDLSGLSTPDL